MDLTHILDDDRGVSPVIGVILMVAITVILAAVIGTFVLGLGSNVGNNAPSATFNWDYGNDTSVNVTHQGGDVIDNSSISYTSDGEINSVAGPTGDDSQWTAGETTTIVYANEVSSGNTTSMVWQSSGGSSSIISSSTYQG
ncbi:type IV pilin [Halarchaeum nitratireducens]|uniref:Archaeal Type IV pilin N-terminal domain-containing protein n=1 Tax=Halarchaeum nitratireducens TaxID=489913 RepID=A0A830GBA3_9EURY|nr:type IV pilin N-terminal domain-containing protein [Halarchaeum nitratireducens]GGN18590.1 hypothetical protein GCM10009021_19480 [Halarchaeum nitratireducens]